MTDFSVAGGYIDLPDDEWLAEHWPVACTCFRDGEFWPDYCALESHRTAARLDKSA